MIFLHLFSLLFMILYQLSRIIYCVHTYLIYMLSNHMNVKSKLKARTVRFVGVDKSRNTSDASVRVQTDSEDDEIKDYNFKTELYNIFLVSVSFFLLFSGYNTLSQLSVIISCLILILANEVDNFRL